MRKLWGPVLVSLALSACNCSNTPAHGGDGGSASDGGGGGGGDAGTDGGPAHLKTVFIILMENHNWSTIFQSASAPYINNVLLDAGSWTTQYFNPPANHPSEPNYLWLEAGTNFGVLDDNAPCLNVQSSTQHLATLLTNAGLSWKSYQEDISGSGCPLNGVNNYAPKHNPFVFFQDVVGYDGGCPWSDTYGGDTPCQQHVRPYSELAADLASNQVANYNFITPNLINDMHNGTIAQGDAWLQANVPAILQSAVFQQGGALFITWDESEGGDFPIGMIVLSPFAKGNGYSNSIHYTHGSTLRTMQEIFGVSPLLGDVANQTDLSDLFKTFP